MMVILFVGFFNYFINLTAALMHLSISSHTQRLADLLIRGAPRQRYMLVIHIKSSNFEFSLLL